MNEIKKTKKWNKLTEFQKKVYEITYKIPEGKISTYGQVAQVMGDKFYSRAVGNALNKNPYAPVIPCHRVIRSDGFVGGFASGLEKKIDLLRKENIIIKNNRIDLRKYLVNDKDLK